MCSSIRTPSFFDKLVHRAPAPVWMAFIKAISCLPPDDCAMVAAVCISVPRKASLKNDRLISAAIILIIGCAVVAYFIRPRQPLLQLVTPQQELPTYQANYPGDPSLANRVLKSYELAFILVRTPYMTTNLTALEAVREWARENFQTHPDFLHPVSLPAPAENHDTVFGALGYNIFAAPRYWLETQVGELVRGQIASFHKRSAFQSFQACYFDMFGKDSEAANLLARYESDRAKQAVDVVLWTLIWWIALTIAAARLVSNRKRDFFDVLRSNTAAVWMLLAVAYLSQAWFSGQSAALISTMAASAFAFYLYRPFMLVSHQEARQQLVRIRLAPCWIATAAWFTFTCLSVQLLTWIRTGIPAAPDPISLFIASLSGNFLHDPVHAKRLITGSVAVTWLLVTAWALLQRYKDQPYAPEPDTNFETLDKAMTFSRLQ